MYVNILEICCEVLIYVTTFFDYQNSVKGG